MNVRLLKFVPDVAAVAAGVKPPMAAPASLATRAMAAGLLSRVIVRMSNKAPEQPGVKGGALWPESAP